MATFATPANNEPPFYELHAIYDRDGLHVSLYAGGVRVPLASYDLHIDLAMLDVTEPGAILKKTAPGPKRIALIMREPGLVAALQQPGTTIASLDEIPQETPPC